MMDNIILIDIYSVWEHCGGCISPGKGFNSQTHLCRDKADLWIHTLLRSIFQGAELSRDETALQDPAVSTYSIEA